MVTDSEHTSGLWDWDYVNKELYFTSTKLVEDTGAGAEQQVRRQVPGCTHAYLELAFNPAPDVAAFRRSCRRDRTLGPEVVTMRDIKDVVLFSVTTPLPLKIVDLLHTAQADRLLRAIIIYMQLYLQTSAELSVREDLVTRDGACVMRISTYPPCVRNEGRMLADLSVLRSVVGREYCSLLLGYGEMRRYHHMSNKLRRSTPEDDLRTHELLHQLAAQIAWVALGRRAQTQPLVAVELGRLLRSNAFNVAEHRAPTPPLSAIKQAVLYGPPDPYGARRKLLVRSVATLDLIALQDYEVAGIGYLDVPYPSHRACMLETALTAPEDTLLDEDVGVFVGVLGHPLADYDDMINLVKFTDDSPDKAYEVKRCPTLVSIGEKAVDADHMKPEQKPAAETEMKTPSGEQRSSPGGSKEAGVAVCREASPVRKAASVERRPSSNVKVVVADEHRASLVKKKSSEIPTARGRIPPAGQFPARKTGFPRGSPDLLEARAIWRRFNKRKTG